MNLEKVLKKGLGDSFENDGFVYEFKNIIYDDGVYSIYVNVILPQKNQSYVRSKFEYDVNNHLFRFSKYLGTSLSYNVSFTVDEEQSDSVYIRPELLYEINEGFNQRFKTMKIFTKKEPLVFNVELDKDDLRFMSYDGGDSIYFNFPLNTYNFRYNDVKIDVSKFSKHKLSEFIGYLTDSINDSDRIREDIDGLIYHIIEPEVRIQDSEVYINPSVYVVAIDGKKVSPSWGSFDIDYFIS